MMSENNRYSKNNSNSDMKGFSKIPEWYSGQKILITGATGFLGKILVEKLLRDCSEIETLYLLVRAKKGVEATARLDEFLSCVVFDNLRKTRPKIFNKIKIIKGDVTLEELGICDNDRNELISNVTCIFHGAACVRFDQPLKDATNLNTMGTYRMLKLAEQMTKLKVFVHVSTAYCHCNEREVEEKGYPPPHNPLGIVQMAKILDNEILESITPRLLNKLPNTYSYTKNLTEGIVAEFSGKLPIVIVRPSIVIAALKEPLPGWIEGLNGPTGVLIGAGRGIIRSMYCNPNYRADVMPVDITVNCLIAIAWERDLNKSKQITYINVTSSEENELTWGQSLDTGRQLLYENPLTFSLWYPDGGITSNYYHHMLCVIFFHYLPAYLIDFLMIIQRKKPFMVRVQTRITQGLKVLQYFTIRNWAFRNENLVALREKLSPKDKEIFNCDIKTVYWPDFLYNYIIGTRVYLLKEGLDTLPAARRFMQRQYYLNQLVKVIFYGTMFYLLWQHRESFLQSLQNAIKFLYFLLNSIKNRIF